MPSTKPLREELDRICAGEHLNMFEIGIAGRPDAVLGNISEVGQDYLRLNPPNNAKPFRIALAYITYAVQRE